MMTIVVAMQHAMHPLAYPFIFETISAEFAILSQENGGGKKLSHALSPFSTITESINQLHPFG